jgi:uncharacterized membrane-anchored protein
MTDVEQPELPPAEGPQPIVATARVGRRTKDLTKRLVPGEIAIIDHDDVDAVAAENLVAAGVVAIVNAAPTITGRYPNRGPLALTAAGIPILDDVGSPVLDAIADGTTVVLDGASLLVDGTEVAHGVRQDADSFAELIDHAQRNMRDELERFVENTLSYIQAEGHLLIDQPEIPDIPVDFRGRQVLVVVRGIDHRKDLQLLARSGYLKEQQPLLVGVDGGADAIMELGLTPDVIIGDMDSVSEAALRSGAALVVHGYTDGRVPGSDVVQRLGLDHVVFASEGTSEDIAMLVAFERGADLIVAVGTHSSMADFLDKGRPGMASTFLVRLKVGPILVDAKGVNRLYDTGVRTRDLLLMVGAAIITLVIISIVSEPVRTVLRGLSLPLR